MQFRSFHLLPWLHSVCMLFTWNLVSMHLKLIYYWFTLIYYFMNIKGCCIFRWSCESFWALGSLGTDKLAASGEFSLFYLVWDSESWNVILNILLMRNQLIILLFCSFFVGWISKCYWVSVCIWKGFVPLCIHIFESTKRWKPGIQLPCRFQFKYIWPQFFQGNSSLKFSSVISFWF